MKSKPSLVEIILISTVIGIAATCAAPWLELRGTFAAWRIVEWHTFWRGEGSFELSSVVAPDYRVPIEYATDDMRSTLAALFALGSALALWHASILGALVILGARMRLRSGEPRQRVALEIAAIVALNTAIIFVLAMLLALPSSLTSKIDFRSGAEIHTSSLIWSNLNLLPVAPAFAIITAVVDGIALLRMWRKH